MPVVAEGVVVAEAAEGVAGVDPWEGGATETAEADQVPYRRPLAETEEKTERTRACQRTPL